MAAILVIHGPNLNLLGTREPEVYGKESLKDINSSLSKAAKKAGVSINFFQSNHEGEIVDKIQESIKRIDTIILNPGGLTHSSVCIRDALLSTKIPCIEVHLSNIFKREEFRKKSMISDIAVGTITGFGSNSYMLGLAAAVNYLKAK